MKLYQCFRGCCLLLEKRFFECLVLSHIDRECRKDVQSIHLLRTNEMHGTLHLSPGKNEYEVHKANDEKTKRGSCCPEKYSVGFMEDNGRKLSNRYELVPDLFSGTHATAKIVKEVSETGLCVS